MQIKNIARISLSARRPAKKQTQLAIRYRVLAQIVINTEYVAVMFVHKILRKSAARIRRDILHRCAVGRRCDDNSRVFHRSVFSQYFNYLGYRRFLLPDGYINADHVFVPLVYNCVYRYGGFAGLAVADYQFSLSASDRYHCIYAFDSGLQRFFYRLTLCYARSVEFH